MLLQDGSYEEAPINGAGGVHRGHGHFPQSSGAVHEIQRDALHQGPALTHRWDAQPGILAHPLLLYSLVMHTLLILLL